MSFNHGCRASFRIKSLSLEAFVATVSAQPWCCSLTAWASETLPQCQQLSLARLGAASQHGPNGFLQGHILHGATVLHPHQPAESECCWAQGLVPQVTGGSALSPKTGLLPAFVPISPRGEKRLSAQAGPRVAASRDGDLDRRGLLPWGAWHGVAPTSARLSGDIPYPSGLTVMRRKTSAGLSPLSSLDKQLLSLPACWGHLW